MPDLRRIPPPPPGSTGALTSDVTVPGGLAWEAGGGGGVASVTAADTSIVVGGSGTNPTVRTNTLDVIAVDHPPVASVPFNAQKITGLANGSAASDGAAFGQIPTALPPNGAAGGDLTGTYPNPTVKASVGLTGTPTAPTAAAGDNSTQIATDAFVTTAINNAIAAVNPAVAVKVATAAVLPNTPTYANGVGGIGATLTANVNNVALVVDGYTPILNERILVKNQVSAFQNGVYVVTQLAGAILPWIATRALDYDQPSDINNTGAIPVVSGTANALTSWLLTSTVNTVGTDALTYSQFTSPGGGGLTAAADPTITVVGSTIKTTFSGVYPAGVALDLGGTTDMVTSTSTTVTSATAQWKNGQVLVIRGGNAAGATYIGTITAGGGTTSVTVSPATTASASGLTGFYGTDDTVSWQAVLRSSLPSATVDAGATFKSLIRQRVDACTTQSSATVLDASCVAGDVGKWVTGAGIPSQTFVGTVNAGVSFTLVNQAGSPVNATASASVNLCLGGLCVCNGVRLLPTGRGPFDPQTNPIRNTWGPTFGIVQSVSVNNLGYNSGNPLIGLTDESAFGDAILYSLNQLAPTVATPTTFAPVMGTVSRDATLSHVAGCRIGSPYIPNAWWGLDLQGGRFLIEHPTIGALTYGVTIDHCQDFIHIRELELGPFWDICEGIAYGPTASTFDAYALNNNATQPNGVRLGRVDGLWIDRLSIFSLFLGVWSDSSPDSGQGIRTAYGQIRSIDIENCAYAVFNNNSASIGILVGALTVIANGTGVGTAGQAAVATGAATAVLVVSSVSINGTFASGNYSQFAGSTLVHPATNPG